MKIKVVAISPLSSKIFESPLIFSRRFFYFTHVGPKNFYVFTGILSGPCRGERFLMHVIHVPLLLIFHSDQIYVILISFIPTKLLESQGMRTESHLFKVRSSVLLQRKCLFPQLQIILRKLCPERAQSSLKNNLSRVRCVCFRCNNHE